MQPIKLDLSLNADPKNVALLVGGVFIASRAGAKIAMGPRRARGNLFTSYSRMGNRRRGQGLLSRALQNALEVKLEEEFRSYRTSPMRRRLADMDPEFDRRSLRCNRPHVDEMPDEGEDESPAEETDGRGD